VPRLTAGQFVAFAFTRSARTKNRLVRDAVEHALLPDYEPPPDYWFRLRGPIVSMISRREYSDARVRAALQKMPDRRRELFARILSDFLENWPRPPSRARPHLRLMFGELVVSCQPHAAVVLGGELRYLRFLYPLNGSVSLKAITEYELLRRATGTRALPGLLHLASARVVAPRVPTSVREFLHAEAAEFERLWRQHGGGA
jgi:hypothetical protein